MLVGALGFLLTACERQPTVATDLLRAGDGFLEGSVAGEPWNLSAEATRFVRLDDVGYRSLPAGPPGRLRFRVALPSRPRLRFACGLAPKYRPPAGVKFVVKVRPDGAEEETIWTRLVDPVARAGDSRWVPGEVDLAPWAGRPLELTLETRGSKDPGEPARAFWGAPTIVGAGNEAPLIVLYLVDTLRADHTGPYGHTRDTTPALDEFAREAVVFEQAVAQASWTKPSVASVITSLLPAEHGASRRLDRLSPHHETLAERLQEKGWATGAVVTNALLYARRAGFDQGFDYFAGLHGRRGHPSRQVRASVAVDAALSWVDARRGLPTFVWIHTMDPHFPYRPPAPFDRMFSPDDIPDLPDGEGGAEADERRKRRHTISRYDGEIAFGDREFGRFLRGLEARGLYDRALIVFLSDHGDEFLDHGGLGHGQTVFDELVRIPLLVKFPGGPHGGQRIAQQVLGIDVMPTILQAAGVQLDGSLAGRPLQDVLAGNEPPVPALVETQHWSATALSVRTETDKYIRRFSPQDDELYFDLVQDPHERINRAQADGERVRALRGQIGQIMRPTPYRYVLRASGSSGYSLTLRTSGVLEQIEVTGLGSGDTNALERDGQGLALELHPQPGAPREVSFLVRPVGAPVRLEGTRDGRPLQPGDVTAAEDRHPETFPFRLPDPERENPPEKARKLFRLPSRETVGLGVWLVESSPETALEIDEDTLEALRVLGYADP